MSSRPSQLFFSMAPPAHKERKESSLFSGGTDCSKLQCKLCSPVVLIVAVGEKQNPAQCLYSVSKGQTRGPPAPAPPPLKTKKGHTVTISCQGVLPKSRSSSQMESDIGTETFRGSLELCPCVLLQGDVALGLK